MNLLFLFCIQNAICGQLFTCISFTEAKEFGSVR
jgi:hypothetical protein